jgi:hypothetical protein
MQRLLFALAGLVLAGLMLFLVSEGFGMLMNGFKTGSPLVGWSTLALMVVGLVVLLWVRLQARRKRKPRNEHGA